jgi:hypothetical protein
LPSKCLQTFLSKIEKIYEKWKTIQQKPQKQKNKKITKKINENLY